MAKIRLTQGCGSKPSYLREPWMFLGATLTLKGVVGSLKVSYAVASGTSLKKSLF